MYAYSVLINQLSLFLHLYTACKKLAPLIWGGAGVCSIDLVALLCVESYIIIHMAIYMTGNSAICGNEQH
jgi:hypothetical protein